MSDKNIILLPDSELTVMQLIWDMARDCGGDYSHITAGAMFERYPEKIGHLKLTTVLTLITRLITKGCIRAEKTGRSNFYIPLVAEDEYKRSAAADFVATVYNNDTKGLISALLGDDSLTVRDIDELRARISKVAKENKNTND